ncbi:hypothetical protein GZH47_27310 [Paenibacillus rhizovicinus]|uniref:HTH LytTR-type domain-containing protein n=1 Tax=Paenibacillus rhizovicinus TaxID=2704463 RepID=A0A6C0P6I9_9BACL|nr:LytTR family transcriptional regulator DNA-binding domain-containing protein [Paenibacillus rhizovicinus]QHW34137.1 hypothetical protein GZH47_27310 [Paenibacillus rhizovicinus]
MQLLLVKRHSKKDFEIVSVDSKEILFMNSYNGQINYQLRDGTILNPPSTFEEHERVLLSENFAKSDRCYVVNMDNVEFYDEQRLRLFFDPEPVDKVAPSAPVSLSRADVVAGVRTASADGNNQTKLKAIKIWP